MKASHLCPPSDAVWCPFSPCPAAQGDLWRVKGSRALGRLQGVRKDLGTQSHKSGETQWGSRDFGGIPGVSSRNGSWIMNHSGSEGLKATSMMVWDGGWRLDSRKKRSVGMGHTGLWGPFKSEVFVSEAGEATGGCLSVCGWQGVTWSDLRWRQESPPEDCLQKREGLEWGQRECREHSQASLAAQERDHGELV